MKPPPRLYSEDDPQTLTGPYDAAPEPTEDLWFLPAEEDEPPAFQPEAASARQVGLIDPAQWQAAADALSGALADLAFDLGRLEERMRGAGQGAVLRLAQAEAASLSWWAGDRISAERLALWQAWRIGATGPDAQGLVRAAWAARMLAQPKPAGRAGQGFPAEAIEALLQQIRQEHPGLQHLPVLVQGAALFSLWRSLDERPDHLREIEAATVAARMAMRSGQSLPFLPVSLAGFAALSATGAPAQRLAAWISGCHQAVLSALMLLARLADWRARAEGALADLSGRTPPLLIESLLAHPLLAAPEAEAATGASRAAVQRNLDVFADRGLIREVTGQGRFRIWTIAL